ncbi:MAG: S8 family serine peptidase [Chitinophagaceae bacterium]|nr:S8 family serine peptidase [Chitinophagaceae bacterium]
MGVHLFTISPVIRNDKIGIPAAKNVLTVGATDTLYNVASFSSRGPVNDGRLKPEIIATGYNVFSTKHFLVMKKAAVPACRGRLLREQLPY